MDARYEHAFERINDAAILLDADNRIVRLNAAARDLIGLPGSQVEGHPIEWFWPGWGEPWSALCEGEDLRTEVIWDAGSGERTFEAHVSVIRDERGAIVDRLIILRDTSACRTDPLHK